MLLAEVLNTLETQLCYLKGPKTAEAGTGLVVTWTYVGLLLLE